TTWSSSAVMESGSNATPHPQARCGKRTPPPAQCGTHAGRYAGRRSSDLGLLLDLALNPAEHAGHATQAQRADRLLQPEPVGHVGGDREQLTGGEAIEPFGQDSGEAAGGGRLLRSGEEQAHPALGTCPL